MNCTGDPHAVATSIIVNFSGCEPEDVKASIAGKVFTLQKDGTNTKRFAAYGLAPFGIHGARLDVTASNAQMTCGVAPKTAYPVAGSCRLEFDVDCQALWTLRVESSPADQEFTIYRESGQACLNRSGTKTRTPRLTRRTVTKIQKIPPADTVVVIVTTRDGQTVEFAFDRRLLAEYSDSAALAEIGPRQDSGGMSTPASRAALKELAKKTKSMTVVVE